MTPVEFKSAIVTRDDGQVVIAFFNGEPEPASIAQLKCSRDAARALRRGLDRAIRSTGRGE